MPKKNVPIKYTSRDYISIKNDLIDHAKRYYPDTFKDFSAAGFGSLMLDAVSYIGDSLSFYLDFQANETFLQNTLEFDNVIKLAKQSGYKFRSNPSSSTQASFYVLVPATSVGNAPNNSYLPTIKQGSTFLAENGTTFVLDEDVTFVNSPVVVARVNSTTGTPTFFAVKSYGKVVSGQLKRTEVTVGTFSKFLKLNLPLSNVSEVISITDSEGKEYYEVDYLSQNTVYRSVTNRDTATKEQASMILKPFVAARRFSVDIYPGSVDIQFGSGREEDFSTETQLDPKNISLSMNGKAYVGDRSLDPSKLVESDNFGISPSNTTLTITYRQNDIDNVNIASNTLNKVANVKTEFEDEANLSSVLVNSVKESIEITNEEPVTGDAENITTEELKSRVLSSYGSQNRAVTEQDYVATVYSMPARYGAVRKATMHRDTNSLRRNMNLFIVSEDSNGKLTSANQTTKKNLKTWINKNKMMNDTIDILDAKVVNLGITFEIIAELELDSVAVLERCISTLKTKYATENPEVGEDFYISDVYNVLNEVDGVVDVVTASVVKKVGSNYADISFDIEKNISPDGRYVVIPKNVIYEIKHPNVDIKGAVR
tara:strand:- start:128605 stop:130398 length:1794 start_codon:yes stop_codon:yes gene_type:complete